MVVSDVMAPLPHIVEMKKNSDNDRMHKVVNSPLYIPFQKKHFDTIRINVMSNIGQPIPFAYGKSVVVVEFRRIGLLEKVL